MIAGEQDRNGGAPETRALTPQEESARRRRILATGLALAGFVLLIFLITVARLQTNIAAGAGA